MTIVYLLRHEIETRDYTYPQIIGVFSSEEGAQQVIERLRDDPQFKGKPGDFVVHPFTLDVTGWQEGFVTMP